MSGPPHVPRDESLTTPRHIGGFIGESQISRLMVAGDRDSRDPGIGERVERFLIVVFKSLGTAPARPERGRIESGGEEIE
jgi:hypothetical protein